MQHETKWHNSFKVNYNLTTFTADFQSLLHHPLVKVNSTYMKHKVWPWTLLHRLVLSIELGTDKLGPGSEIQITTAALVTCLLQHISDKINIRTQWFINYQHLYCQYGERLLKKLIETMKWNDCNKPDLILLTPSKWTVKKNLNIHLASSNKLQLRSLESSTLFDSFVNPNILALKYFQPLTMLRVKSSLT